MYNDAGHSAKDLKRPQLENLIKDIKKGIIDVVVAIKVDRLSREGYDGQWFLKYCKDNNCVIDLLYEKYDINTPDGEMMYGMSLLFGQRERREIGSRTKRGMEEAIKQGKYPNKAPYGFKKNKDGYLEIEQVSANVVKEIFELYAKGNSVIKIVDIMAKGNRYINDNGTGKWHEERVKNIVINPIYKGELHWGLFTRNISNILIMPNFCEPIVEPSLFDRCQNQKEKNSHGNYGKYIHIFHQVIRCPSCHKLMNNYYSIKHKNKKVERFFYVRCDNGNCSNFAKNYNATKIEKELVNLLNELSRIALTNEYFINFPNEKNHEEITKLDKAIEKLITDEKKLITALLNTDITPDLINKKIEQIKNEKGKLEIKRSKLTNGTTLRYNNDILSLVDTNTLQTKDIKKVWELLNPQAKREIVDKYIKYVDVAITDDSKCDYKIAITNIEFNTDFLQTKLYNLNNYLTDKIKNLHNGIVAKGIFTEEEFKKLKIRKQISSFNELMKNTNYRDKSMETILKKINKQDIEFAYIIDENKKIKDVAIIY